MASLVPEAADREERIVPPMSRDGRRHGKVPNMRGNTLRLLRPMRSYYWDVI
jgi:hypothetical protein